MRSKYAVHLLLAALALQAVSGCIAQEKTGALTVPSENLPGEFRLIAAKNESTPGINMADELKEFSTPKDIGPAKFVMGHYYWWPPDRSYDVKRYYDSKITVISLVDEGHAQAAVSNYLENYRGNHTTELPGNVSLINPVVVNGHEATEIGEILDESRIQYLYLWNNKTLAVLVEGNETREISMKFASTTGL